MSTQHLNNSVRFYLLVLTFSVAVAPAALADIEVEPDGLSWTRVPSVTRDIEVEPDGLSVTRDIEVEPDGLI